MIKTFEQGKSYRWIGKHERPSMRVSWVSNMDAFFDGNPRKCIQSRMHQDKRGCHATFEGISGAGWNYSDDVFQYFEEVSDGKPSRRPTVGDTVRVVSDNYVLHGKIGKIILDDHRSMPYNVDFSGHPVWLYERDVALYEEKHAPKLSISFTRKEEAKPLEFQSLEDIRRSVVSEINFK